MPTFQFEAMDATGQEIKDVIEAATEEEAQTTIRQMGYFVTKIALQKSDKQKIKGGKGKTFAIGGAGGMNDQRGQDDAAHQPPPRNGPVVPVAPPERAFEGVAEFATVGRDEDW